MHPTTPTTKGSTPTATSNRKTREHPRPGRAPGSGRRTLPLVTALFVFSSLAGFADRAAAQSGVQITPDDRVSLVSKDVGDQRWAIAYDRVTGLITGNVFYPDGGDPSFVWCEQLESDDDPQDGEGTIRFSCFGADRCDAAPCPPETWTFLTEVDLQESFLLPPPAPGGDEVPTENEALFAYLQSGAYRSFSGESAPHPSAGPHGFVRTWVNGTLEASLAAGNTSHPVGAAAVKELYSAGGTTPTGWAVEVKTDSDSAGGQGWYWYEVFSTTDGSRPISGQGSPVCTGCHSEGRDFVLVPFPLS